MSRYEELKRIFQKGKYFKVVCGAGNEDPAEVYKLTLVYALAGATAIDISANVDVVKSAVTALDKAEELAPKLKRKIKIRPFINVSVGLKGDPHVRKARIKYNICIKCGKCLEACLQGAINNDFIIQEIRCIGCGACERVCGQKAVEFYNRKVDFDRILPECIANGTETLELHAIIPDDNAVMADWGVIDSLIPNNFISMCLDRSQLSDTHLIRRIKEVYEISGSRLVIQADGAPMSGGKDDYNTTLQTIAIADIIRKSKIPVFVTASGGTNSKTGELAKLCGVEINGVAIGTFARKIIKDHIGKKDFQGNIKLIEKAVSTAEKLILDNMR
ncbi:MAG: LdpA C-terminal domain-containing domain [Candidatus Altiarchaeota archaeon]